MIATHTDTETVHSHIIVNAVDPITGKKLQFSKAEYAAMKDEVNRIGKEHGYTETDFRKRSRNNRTSAEKKIILKGGTSWKEELREVIAEGIKNSKTPEAFVAALKVKCAKKGLNYENELSAHKRDLSDKERKNAEKKRVAEEKTAEKEKRAAERKATQLAALSPEKRAALEQKAKLRAEKEERKWQAELKAGEAYRAKIQAELAAKG